MEDFGFDNEESHQHEHGQAYNQHLTNLGIQGTTGLLQKAASQPAGWTCRAQVRADIVFVESDAKVYASNAAASKDRLPIDPMHSMTDLHPTALP